MAGLLAVAVCPFCFLIFVANLYGGTRSNDHMGYFATLVGRQIE